MDIVTIAVVVILIIGVAAIVAWHWSKVGPYIGSLHPLVKIILYTLAALLAIVVLVYIAGLVTGRPFMGLR